MLKVNEGNVGLENPFHLHAENKRSTLHPRLHLASLKNRVSPEQFGNGQLNQLFSKIVLQTISLISQFHSQCCPAAHAGNLPKK